VRLFGKVNGRIDRYDRAEMLTPPFDLTTLTKFLRLSPILLAIRTRAAIVLEARDRAALQLKTSDKAALAVGLAPRGG